MPVHSLWFSYIHFEIGAHHLFNPTDSCIFDYPLVIELLTSLIEFQSFQYHVHTDFVAELETVGECFFGTVDFDGYSVDFMFLKSSVICLIGESVNEEWRIVKGWLP
jgi:hypothetical protein